jgi:hypothetical protein
MIPYTAKAILKKERVTEGDQMKDERCFLGKTYIWLDVGYEDGNEFWGKLLMLSHADYLFQDSESLFPSRGVFRREMDRVSISLNSSISPLLIFRSYKA